MTRHGRARGQPDRRGVYGNGEPGPGCGDQGRTRRVSLGVLPAIPLRSWAGQGTHVTWKTTPSTTDRTPHGARFVFPRAVRGGRVPSDGSSHGGREHRKLIWTLSSAYGDALAELGLEEDTAVLRRFFCSDLSNQGTALEKHPFSNRDGSLAVLHFMGVPAACARRQGRALGLPRQRPDRGSRTVQDERNIHVETWRAVPPLDHRHDQPEWEHRLRPDPRGLQEIRRDAARRRSVALQTTWCARGSLSETSMRTTAEWSMRVQSSLPTTG